MTCGLTAEDLRAGQATDAEIKAHLFLHDKGRCPATDDDVRDEYEQLVRAFSEGRARA